MVWLLCYMHTNDLIPWIVKVTAGANSGNLPFINVAMHSINDWLYTGIALIFKVGTPALTSKFTPRRPSEPNGIPLTLQPMTSADIWMHWNIAVSSIDTFSDIGSNAKSVWCTIIQYYCTMS